MKTPIGRILYALEMGVIFILAGAILPPVIAFFLGLDAELQNNYASVPPSIKSGVVMGLLMFGIAASIPLRKIGCSGITGMYIDVADPQLVIQEIDCEIGKLVSMSNEPGKKQAVINSKIEKLTTLKSSVKKNY